jgi:hypothetical protein
MNQSDSIKNLAAALVKFQAAAPAIGRDAVNPFFKSKYATLGNIISKIAPVLSECGLSVSCIPDGEDSLRVMLMHTSGEFISGSYKMKPVKADPQALGSAITYQRRYAITAILNLNVDDDDDGNAASQSQHKALKQRKPKLSQERYIKMVEAIDTGTYTKEEALNSFELTAQQRAEIEAL